MTFWAPSLFAVFTATLIAPLATPSTAMSPIIFLTFTRAAFLAVVTPILPATPPAMKISPIVEKNWLPTAPPIPPALIDLSFQLRNCAMVSLSARVPSPRENLLDAPMMLEISMPSPIMPANGRYSALLLSPPRDVLPHASSIPMSSRFLPSRW